MPSILRLQLNGEGIKPLIYNNESVRSRIVDYCQHVRERIEEWFSGSPSMNRSSRKFGLVSRVLVNFLALENGKLPDEDRVKLKPEDKLELEQLPLEFAKLDDRKTHASFTIFLHTDNPERTDELRDGGLAADIGANFNKVLNQLLAPLGYHVARMDVSPAADFSDKRKVTEKLAFKCNVGLGRSREMNVNYDSGRMPTIAKRPMRRFASL